MPVNPFKADHQQLLTRFSDLGISTEAPGFCDLPPFLAAEAEDPDYLNNYAAFISKKPYSAEYLAFAKRKIEKACDLLSVELIKHGRLGACVDISGILFRILEEEGIWSCCIKGSLTIGFPSGSGIGTKYFWSSDIGQFVAGHAWLFAPPFTVVDITARLQPYKGKERNYIPNKVLSTRTKHATVRTEDVVSPEARLMLQARGIPPQDHLGTAAHLIPDIFESLPPIEVNGFKGSKLKYVPVAIHAPQEKLRDINNMTFDGLSPWELYIEKFKGKLD